MINELSNLKFSWKALVTHRGRGEESHMKRQRRQGEEREATTDDDGEEGTRLSHGERRNHVIVFYFLLK